MGGRNQENRSASSPSPSRGLTPVLHDLLTHFLEAEGTSAGDLLRPDRGAHHADSMLVRIFEVHAAQLASQLTPELLDKVAVW